MPIQLTCQCGKKLSIPDSMAGKSGKCPACAQVLKIPGNRLGPDKQATSGKPSKEGSKPKGQAKKGTGAVATSVTAPGSLASLFDEAGLDGKAKGPTCPSCGSNIPPNAAICIECGFNLSTGQRMKTKVIVQTNDAEEDEAPDTFDHWQLNHAAKSLKKEKEEDERLQFAGSPWWMTLALLLGLVTIIYFGVIRVEAMTNDSEGNKMIASERVIKGRIQRLSIQNLLILVTFSVSLLSTTMAFLAVCIFAFKRKLQDGALCLFVPFYAHYYSFRFRKKLGSTSRVLIVWSVVAIAFTVLMFTSGTWNRIMFVPKS